jgi:hypothetical protein
MRLTPRHAVYAAVLLCGLLMNAVTAQNVDRLPARLSDKEFWQLVTDFSEPTGSFPSPNFVSNERSFQTVLPQLAVDRQPGSAYIGVGPEQNFTYLVTLQPKIAFILDIRRQNLVLHLTYKALFEMSSDRADFLARLFSRPRPPNLSGTSTVDELFEAFRDVPQDPESLANNRAVVKKRLIEEHGFVLSEEDIAGLDLALTAFGVGGPYLTYGGVYRNPNLPNRIIPTFEELMRETDGAGRHRSFLATEDNFRRIQDLQRKNLIIPVVGNFAGPHALPAIGKYLRDNRAIVSAFYVSNVEQYLFGDGIATAFYTSVSTLPINEKSVLIRALVRNLAGVLSPSPVINQSTQIEVGLYPMKDLVTDYTDGSIQIYTDILKGRF